MKTKAKPRLTGKTVRTLDVLATLGKGGANAEDVAKACGLRTQQASARLRWLARGGLVRYVKDTAIWQLTDDALVRQPQ